jgi:hypothetical protein
LEKSLKEKIRIGYPVVHPTWHSSRLCICMLIGSWRLTTRQIDELIPATSSKRNLRLLLVEIWLLLIQCSQNFGSQWLVFPKNSLRTVIATCKCTIIGKITPSAKSMSQTSLSTIDAYNQRRWNAKCHVCPWCTSYKVHQESTILKLNVYLDCNVWFMRVVWLVITTLKFWSHVNKKITFHPKKI